MDEQQGSGGFFRAGERLQGWETRAQALFERFHAEGEARIELWSSLPWVRELLDGAASVWAAGAGAATDLRRGLRGWRQR